MVETLTFFPPEEMFNSLKNKLNAKNVPELTNYLKGSFNKEERELFYGAIFATGLKHITKHEILMKAAEKEPGDIEILDKNIWDTNQSLPKTKRAPSHWRVQNLLLTEHVLKNKIKKGINNIYQIVDEHLSRTKLTDKKDYKGYMLVFHFQLNIKGKFDVRILREKIRKIKQKNFEQIWITCFSSPRFDKCTITELLIYDYELIQYPISIF